MNRAVFLDRDGVITEDEPSYVHEPGQLKLIPGSAKAIKLLNENGFKVVVVCNQSGVARGYYREEDVETFNEAMMAELNKWDAYIDATYYCPHHPQAEIEAYRVDCNCRKPKPGMLQKASKDLKIDLKSSFMVGDKLDDVRAGQNAGCKINILVLTGHGRDELKNSHIERDFVHLCLLESIKTILNHK